jgi:hypothetical protein
VRWMDIDGAVEYLAQQPGGKRLSRKSIYNMVTDGMRVARLGETGRRFLFAAEFIDDYLLSKTSRQQGREPKNESPVTAVDAGTRPQVMQRHDLNTSPSGGATHGRHGITGSAH